MKISKLPRDKSAKIVIYCRSGNMSAEVAEKLVKKGYTDICNVLGGTFAWRQAGYSIK